MRQDDDQEIDRHGSQELAIQQHQWNENWR